MTDTNQTTGVVDAGAVVVAEEVATTDSVGNHPAVEAEASVVAPIEEVAVVAVEETPVTDAPADDSVGIHVAEVAPVAEAAE